MRERTSFVERALRGEASNLEQAIDDAVSAWHSNPTGEGGRLPSLPQWLGFDPTEYAHWVEHPEDLDVVLEAHRVRCGYWTEPAAPPRLPDGWTRRYEPYWSCAAYVLYAHEEHGAEAFSICERGITMNADHLVLSRDDWQALMSAVYADYFALSESADAAEEKYGDTGWMTPAKVIAAVRAQMRRVPA